MAANIYTIGQYAAENWYGIDALDSHTAAPKASRCSAACFAMRAASSPTARSFATATA